MISEKTNWPTAFTERIRKQFPETAEEFLESLDFQSKVSVRLNPGKFDRKFGLEQVPWSSNAYFLDERPLFTLDPLWHAGAYYAQEASSMFLEQVFQQIQTGHPRLILDLCAAPGGKSTHLNSLMQADDLLVANEVIRARVPVLIENLSKWGHSNFLVSSSDPAQFGKTGALFDVLVVDAPCSGEGLFRRDPAAANEWSLENAGHCAVRQRRILAESRYCLKSGGYLIYSTCTFNPAENEENLSWLKNQGGFKSIRVPVLPGWQVDELEYDGIWAYRFLPHKTKGEGFFIALLQKTEESRPVRFPGRFKTKLQKPAVVSQNWVLQPETKKFFQHQDQLKFIPAAWEKEILLLFEQVNLVKAGTTMGLVKKHDVLPEHELSMCLDLNRSAFPRAELLPEDAIRYLARDQFRLNDQNENWLLATFREIPLGFIKNLGSRFNNYYPKEWRLRMQARPENKLWYDRDFF
ncbi:methyltransferase RsmF C-terminal domain-like protein [Gaoshiqia sp. Z1-71]|uniref:methyltransferase RsmF C-terminal domain-like protein n=1 Tax=Gaoshiqia hydrogeniformans TaxID=3290090 RepID=UPI003BF80683